MSSPSLAAVLFTDLVDSTAQRSELGEDVADELRRTHDRLLTEAVEAHGGRVVKSTGDGIMATFPGAAEATAGAVAIQQTIDRHNHRADAIAPLSVRTGVSLGDVTWEDGDVFGTPAIEAARLCARAEGGQILAADVVRLLAGTRTGDVFVPVGDLDLKGLAGPTTVHEIHWDPATQPAIPLPGGLRPVGGFSFVGRQPELALLDDAWQAVTAGQRRAVFLAGEPGIGKTRLISQFAHHATNHGGVVLYGRAEQELGIPYKPIVEALTSYLRTCPDQELTHQTGSLTGELTRLVPQLADRIPDLPEPLQAEPETQRYRLFDAITELLATASHTWPLVLALDDLQWAAKPTILLLGHLLHTDLPTRLLLIAAYRHTETGTDHPLTGLLTEAHRIPDVTTCTIEGLEQAAVAVMTTEATGEQHHAGELTSDLYDATDGNPFFVSEILQAVRERATDGAGVDPAALGVPDGALAMVTARVARLDPQHRPVLETAAVIGQRFDLPLLCAAIGDDDLVLRALAEAETTGLIGTETLLGGQQFAHALIRDGLYTSLPPTERIRQHGHIAAALERLPDRDNRRAELASHYQHAIPLLGSDPAATAAWRAGDQARAALAFEEAATHYGSALDAYAQAPRTPLGPICDLQIDLAEALYRAGDYPAGQQAMLEAADTARRLDDTERLARAPLAGDVGGIAGASLRPGSDPVTDLAEEAAERLGGKDSVDRARLLAYVATRTAYALPARSRQFAEQAVDMARRLDDEPTLVRVLQDTYTPLQTAENLPERIRVWGDEFITLARAVGDLEAANRGLMYRAGCYMETCDLDLAEADLDEAERLLNVLRQPAFAFYVTLGRACMALLKGRLEEAERLIDNLLQQSEHLTGGLPRAAAATLAILLWQRGQLVHVRETAIALTEEQPDAGSRAMLALILAETGSQDDARQLLDDLAERQFADLPNDSLWLTLMTTLAHAAIETGPTTASAAIERALQPYADRIATQGMFPFGPVATALGSLAAVQGNYETAEEHYRFAVDLCERWDLRSWLATTRLHWAQMLVTRNKPDDRPRADALARQALAAAEEIGMQRVAELARDLLQSV